MERGVGGVGAKIIMDCWPAFRFALADRGEILATSSVLLN
jgi:hypothetical protein